MTLFSERLKQILKDFVLAHLSGQSKIPSVLPSKPNVNSTTVLTSSLKQPQEQSGEFEDIVNKRLQLDGAILMCIGNAKNVTREECD